MLESVALILHYCFRNSLIHRPEPRETSGPRERGIFHLLLAARGTFTKNFSYSSGTILVLCNDRSTVRVIQGLNDLSPDEHGVESANFTYFPLLLIRHQNFDDICESYLFERQVFAVEHNMIKLWAAGRNMRKDNSIKTI